MVFDLLQHMKFYTQMVGWAAGGWLVGPLAARPLPLAAARFRKPAASGSLRLCGKPSTEAGNILTICFSLKIGKSNILE